MHRKKSSKFKVQSSKFRQGGFTIIEVMVYGIVFSLFLLLVTQFFLTVKNMAANSFVFVNLQENYVRAFTDFEQTIRTADSVTAPVVGGAGQVLSLNNSQIIYRQENGILKKEIGGSAYDLTDEGVVVKDLSFENIGAVTQKSSVRIKMTLDSNYLLESGRIISEDFQTTVGLR